MIDNTIIIHCIYRRHLGKPSCKKNVFFRALSITSPPPPPNLGKLYHFFYVKNDVSACITEPSNDDYDNDVSDN